MSSFLSNIFRDVAKVVVGGAALQAKSTGIPAVAEADLLAVETGIVDYEAGRPVVLSTFSEGARAGKIIAIADGGQAAKALDL